MAKPQQVVERIEPEALAHQPEAFLSSDVLRAQVVAEIQARHAIAQRFPRNEDAARSKLLKECERPLFAEAAQYRKPVGAKDLEGPSIRFAEACARTRGNIATDASIVDETATHRKLRVTGTDLETNSTYTVDVILRKTVERKNPKGRDVVSERVNSYGEVTYAVAATEDEMLTAQMAQTSKAIRTVILRLTPQHLIEEALGLCEKTMRDANAKDPDAARNRLIDGFGKLNVSVEMLEGFLGHGLSQTTPTELASLRKVYAGVNEGLSSWAEVMEARGGQKSPLTAPLKAAEPSPETGRPPPPPPVVEPKPASEPAPLPPVEAPKAKAKEPEHPFEEGAGMHAGMTPAEKEAVKPKTKAKKEAAPALSKEELEALIVAMRKAASKAPALSVFKAEFEAHVEAAADDDVTRTFKTIVRGLR